MPGITLKTDINKILGKIGFINIIPCYFFIGETAPGQSIKEERQSGKEADNEVVVYNPNKSLSIEQQRQKLPIFKVGLFGHVRF